jgi:hypothetical protein
VTWLRGLGVAVALVVCAWFALGFVESHELSAATAAVSSARPLDVSHVRSLLSDASTLNPDRSVDIVRAQLLVRQGRLAAARRVLESVVQAEPDNLEAWYWVAKASPDQPRLFLLALLRIRQLEPPIR